VRDYIRSAVLADKVEMDLRRVLDEVAERGSLLPRARVNSTQMPEKKGNRLMCLERDGPLLPEDDNGASVLTAGEGGGRRCTLLLLHC
jgi:hypothetical protein